MYVCPFLSWFVYWSVYKMYFIKYMPLSYVWISLRDCVTVWIFWCQFPVASLGCVCASLCSYLPAQSFISMYVSIFTCWIHFLLFSFSVSATFYLLLSPSPGAGSTAEWVRRHTLKSDCLWPDLSSATYCEMTLDKYLHISELQFSHLKYADDNRAQS